MRAIDDKAVMASTLQGQELEAFIMEYELYILRCASNISKRYITKSDDEWSIALIAFTTAVQTYRLEKGAFLKYAQKVIHNSLVDYFRKQGKYFPEVHVDLEEDNYFIKEDEAYLKLEIEALTEILSSYGFDFMDLVDNAPKAKKTKLFCGKAINYMLDQPILVLEMQRSKMLPIKNIVLFLKIPRKIIERHRKYIIAAVEILWGDYPYLSEYLITLRKEANR